jgi:hypothetical protein
MLSSASSSLSDATTDQHHDRAGWGRPIRLGYACKETRGRGRLVIRVQKVANGHQHTIRLEGGRRLLVSSVVTAKGGSLRASRACLRNQP